MSCPPSTSLAAAHAVSPRPTMPARDARLLQGISREQRHRIYRQYQERLSVALDAAATLSTDRHAALLEYMDGHISRLARRHKITTQQVVAVVHAESHGLV